MIQRNILRSTTNISRQNLKKCSNHPEECKKRTEEEEEIEESNREKSDKLT